MKKKKPWPVASQLSHEGKVCVRNCGNLKWICAKLQLAFRQAAWSETNHFLSQHHQNFPYQLTDFAIVCITPRYKSFNLSSNCCDNKSLSIWWSLCHVVAQQQRFRALVSIKTSTDECVAVTAAQCDGSKWRQSVWARRRWDYLLVQKDKPSTGETSIPDSPFAAKRHSFMHNKHIRSLINGKVRGLKKEKLQISDCINSQKLI